MRFFEVLVVCLGMVASAQLHMIKHGVTCEDVRNIIAIHNDFRQSVANGSLGGQPKASNMQRIVWDDALAKIAQHWANGMTFMHNPNRHDDRFSVGENIYMSFATGPNADFDWQGAIQSWFDENKDYTYEAMGGDLTSGHYTQLVWADTTRVGCGVTFYNSDKGMKNKLYVCDYGPAGNFLGEFPYKTGAGCEKLCCGSQCDKMHGDEC